MSAHFPPRDLQPGIPYLLSHFQNPPLEAHLLRAQIFILKWLNVRTHHPPFHAHPHLFPSTSKIRPVTNRVPVSSLLLQHSSPPTMMAAWLPRPKDTGHQCEGLFSIPFPRPPACSGWRTSSLHISTSRPFLLLSFITSVHSHCIHQTTPSTTQITCLGDLSFWAASFSLAHFVFLLGDDDTHVDAPSSSPTSV